MPGAAATTGWPGLTRKSRPLKSDDELKIRVTEPGTGHCQRHLSGSLTEREGVAVPLLEVSEALARDVALAAAEEPVLAEPADFPVLDEPLAITLACFTREVSSVNRCPR